jgi:hypothetical protein
MGNKKQPPDLNDAHEWLAGYASWDTSAGKRQFDAYDMTEAYLSGARVAEARAERRAQEEENAQFVPPDWLREPWTEKEEDEEDEQLP